MRFIRLMGLIGLMGLMGCTPEETEGPQGDTQEERLLPMTMTICLQPDSDMPTRTMGDPGTYEHFNYPRYFYVYAVGFTDAGVYSEANGGMVCPIKIGDNYVNRIDVGNDPEDWQAYLMTVDPPQTLMDSVYGNKQIINFKIPESITKMRFYVAASATELVHDGHKLGIKVEDDDQVMDSENRESDVLNLRFDVDANLRSHLHDLYSSPYNYAPDGHPYDGLYYYTIVPDPSTGKIKSEDITRIIYHVAAKVDVKWNVNKAQQPNYGLTYIQARKLKQEDCYLFRHTENLWTSTDEANNYNLDLMLDDIGQQWYGRQYFYTIPFRYDDNGNGSHDSGENKFDINLHLLKSPDTKDVPPTPPADGYNLRHRRDLSATTYNVFAPWVRLDLDITGDLY